MNIDENMTVSQENIRCSLTGEVNRSDKDREFIVEVYEENRGHLNWKYADHVHSL